MKTGERFSEHSLLWDDAQQHRLVSSMERNRIGKSRSAAPELPWSICDKIQALSDIGPSLASVERVLTRTDHRRWDAGYRWRAEQYGVFHVCHAVFVDVTENAPTIPNDYLLTAFGRCPGTQNPGSLPEEQFHRLLQLAGIFVPPSGR